MTPRFPNPAAWDGNPTFLVDSVRSILSISQADPDVQNRLVPLSYAVTTLVREHLDEELPFDDVDQTTVIPDPITQACVYALLEAYRRKDSMFGIIGAWSADGIAVRVSRDWLDGVKAVLQPYRERFGVA